MFSAQRIFRHASVLRNTDKAGSSQVTYLAKAPEDQESICFAAVSLAEAGGTPWCKCALAVTETGSAAVVGGERMSPLTVGFVGDTGTV